MIILYTEVLKVIKYIIWKIKVPRQTTQGPHTQRRSTHDFLLKGQIVYATYC